MPLVEGIFLQLSFGRNASAVAWDVDMHMIKKLVPSSFMFKIGTDRSEQLQHSFTELCLNVIRDFVDNRRVVDIFCGCNDT